MSDTYGYNRIEKNDCLCMRVRACIVYGRKEAKQSRQQRCIGAHLSV